MSNSAPTAIYRYRPAVLVLIGAAASYTAYFVYSSLQAAPSDGLHRSNAVRRSNPQRRPSRTTRIITRLERDIQTLGVYNILGLVVPLDPQNLIAPDELRELIVSLVPGAGEDTIEVETAHLYDVFLDRLLDSAFSNRPLAPAEIEAVTRWVGGRLPDPNTVSRAVERRTQHLTDARAAEADVAESVAATDISWNSEEDTDGEDIDPDGQTLQRTLYHIAEDRARQEGVIHRGITCNSCDEKPIRGTRWHCANCVDFDLCSTCEATNSHTRTHVFYKIRVPAPYLSVAKQEPLYPGKPHMMHHSVSSALKKRLASEAKMEVEEIEALWDQFTCLASTEWTDDPNKVGWALDRRAFNHAFVPRYNGFVAAPNLIYDRIFMYFDSDRNGLIGFEEWIKGIDGMHTTDTKVKARIVFNGYDIDGDGYISRRDVLRVFRAYYAIEKEATRNFVAELTEELSVRNGMDTIQSSQPLGSAFPPNSLPTPNDPHPSLAQKRNDVLGDTSPVILDTDLEIADRETIIRSAEISTLLEGQSGEGAEGHLHRQAWARREFTLDEEEGLTKPEGAEDSDDEGEQEHNYAGSSNPGAKSVRTVFRRASKVHFQDEVSHKDWSQKSAAKKPVSKHWTGYEIPKLEQDFGKEVLYQITEQAFNELLDPLFRIKEDMALDARNLRSERRKHAKAIDAWSEKEKGWGKYNSAIFHMGIFRFVEYVVDVFCQRVSMPGVLETLKLQALESDKVPYISAINTAILAAERNVLETLNSPREPPHLDDIAEWNAELFKKQLYLEIATAVFRVLTGPGCVTSKDLNPDTGRQTKSQESPRDLTMPQFRPNSVTNLATDASADAVEDFQKSIYQSQFEEYFEDFPKDGGRVRIGPSSPFFVGVCRPTDSNPSCGDDQARELTTPTASAPTGTDLRESEGRLVIDASIAPNNVPTTPIPNHDASEEASSSSAYPIKPLRVTIMPWLQTLCLQTSPSGSSIISRERQEAVHYTNTYATTPEPDQTAVLTANLRRSAKSSESPLYTRLLASCEAVEQESREREGSGLLCFEEFEQHLKDGRLRFLESWMDWVSL